MVKSIKIAIWGTTSFRVFRPLALNSSSRYSSSHAHPSVNLTRTRKQPLDMDDPYEDRSMPTDPGSVHYDADDLLADLENMKPPELDYYAVLNLSKTVSLASPDSRIASDSVFYSCSQPVRPVRSGIRSSILKWLSKAHH